MASVDRIQGLSGQQAIKTPCALATTANITLSGEQSIDGTTTSSSRVLVKDQTDTTENGIYDTGSGAWTRALDFDGPNDITDGTMVLVGGGSTNADLVFKLNATEPIVIGTTALTFTVATTFTDISAFGATLLDDANAAAARTTLGLVIGTNVQAQNATLQALADQTEAANKIQYYTADNTPGLLDFKDEDNMASDSATAVPSQQSVKAYVDALATPIFTAAYDSGNQTITSGGALALAHSLGVAPKIVQCFIKCTDAGGDVGWAQDDVVAISVSAGDGGTSAATIGVAVYCDATNVNIRFADGGQLVRVPNKSTGTVGAITNSKWAFIVRAYA